MSLSMASMSSIGSAKLAGVFCQAIECVECGEEALIVRQSSGVDTVACPCCATVTARASRARMICGSPDRG